jgi:hypothetical protein
MRITKIVNNLEKVDMQPNGIFFLSYGTVIAYIKGRTEKVTKASYSVTTTKHKNKLLGKELRPNAEVVDAEELGNLAKEAGLDCDY